ncbi:sulfite exporter TauE/SafE family protein [Sphingoaurantiacus capsulatus]|uniref:Probable membrane transporter protein n=1 Tax=Sphingoaurantiacus capsulatus TaxID=1771310 RepID=A0ABV7XCD3_9SPHN
MEFDLVTFIAIGFAAQLIDGALGMAFGVISSTMLIAVGVPPRVASAGVHAVECVTTGVSGISHALHGNIDWKLFRRLVLPGVIGGVLGAYVLTNLPADVAKPFVLAYLTAIGGILLYKAFRPLPQAKSPKVVAPLGLVGGFLDAAGGGGWGPVVTGNLLVQGGDPRKTIGTVNSSEFFIALATSIAFITHLGWEVITTATIGLLIGGVAAAPFGALLAKRIPARTLMILVGIVLIATSGYGIFKALS